MEVLWSQDLFRVFGFHVSWIRVASGFSGLRFSRFGLQVFRDIIGLGLTGFDGPLLDEATRSSRA